MTRKKVCILVCLVIVFVIIPILLFLSGTLVYNGRNTRIDLPNIEAVIKIEMEEHTNGRINGDVATIENPSEINDVISALSEARLPILISSLYWARSANDTPLKENYLSISIYGVEQEYYRVFLYTENNSGYVYVPYRAVYRIDQTVIGKLYQISEEQNEN